MMMMILFVAVVVFGTSSGRSWQWMIGSNATITGTDTSRILNASSTILGIIKGNQFRTHILFVGCELPFNNPHGAMIIVSISIVVIIVDHSKGTMDSSAGSQHGFIHLERQFVRCHANEEWKIGSHLAIGTFGDRWNVGGVFE